MTAAADKIRAKEVEGWVVTTAESNGWSVIRCHGTTPGQPSLPDLLLFRGSERVAVKVMTRKAGRRGPSAAQTGWLDVLTSAGFETFVWTPDHLTDAFDRLTCDTPPTAPGAVAEGEPPPEPAATRETAAERPLP